MRIQASNHIDSLVAKLRHLGIPIDHLKDETDLQSFVTLINGPTKFDIVFFQEKKYMKEKVKKYDYYIYLLYTYICDKSNIVTSFTFKRKMQTSAYKNWQKKFTK